jgi:hypothetical protein
LNLGEDVLPENLSPPAVLFHISTTALVPVLPVYCCVRFEQYYKLDWIPEYVALSPSVDACQSQQTACGGESLGLRSLEAR